MKRSAFIGWTLGVIVTVACLGLWASRAAAERQLRLPHPGAVAVGTDVGSAPRSGGSHPDAVLFRPPDDGGSGGERWGGDILVADQLSDVEGFTEMVGGTSGRYYLVTESMDNTCINIYRSENGGASWWKWGYLCGVAGYDVVVGSVAIPEIAEDYLYISFWYDGWAQVARCNVAANTMEVFDIGPCGAGECLPRLTTDDLDFYPYWIYAVYGNGRFVHSEDSGATWTQLTYLHPDAYSVTKADVAFAGSVVYASWWYYIGGAAGEGAKGDGTLRLPYGVATRRSLDYGSTWDPIVYLCEDCDSPRIDAIEHGTQVMVVYDQNAGTDRDVRCSYSTNSGVNWIMNQCIGCDVGVNETRPDVGVDFNLGSFRVAFWKQGNDIIYKQSPYSYPVAWSMPRTVNDTHQASGDYAPPAVAVNGLTGGGVAWSDDRTATNAIYFDAQGRHVYRVNPTGTGDLPTIQAAINIAASGDTVLLAPGVYRGSQNRDLDTMGKAIVIKGEDDTGSAIIDCQGASNDPHRGFIIQSGEGAGTVIQGLKIMNAYVATNATGGGMWIINSAPTILLCTFENNRAGSGAGITCYQSDATVNWCTFRMNDASDAGGAIYNNTCSPEIANCIFYDNYGLWGGGGIYTQFGSPGILSCLFLQNHTDYWGGAIHNRYSNCLPTISGCIFNGNRALQGGGVFNRDGAVPRVESCTFYGNSASFGGGIYSTGSGSSMQASRTIVSFSALGEAVACASGGSASLVCCDVYGNAGGDWVGCIQSQQNLNGNMRADPLYCGAPGGNFFLMEDSPCLPENNTCGVLIGAVGEGCAASDVADGPPAAKILLAQNNPNPFRSGTEISFEIPRAERVDLKIFDAGGRAVRLLTSRLYPAGPHRVRWDGRDDEGRDLPAGAYLCRLKVGEAIRSRSIVILR